MFKRDRVYIVPTRYGHMYGAGIVICVLYGMVYANNLAYLLSFFLLGIFVIGMHQSNSNLKKLSIEKIIFEPMAANSKGIARVYLKSNSSEGHIKVSLKSKKFIDKFSSSVEQVQPHSMHINRIHVKTDKRGKRQLPKLTLYSIYPFGLFYVWKNFDIDNYYYVYPKPIGDRPLPSKANIGHSLGKSEIQSGDEFEQHKLYQNGDSQKRIDWKAFARGRPKLIKEFKQNSQGEVKLIQKGFGLEQEQDLEQLCKWVHQCEKLNLNYSLELNNFKIKTGRGYSHKQKCLKALAEV